VGKGQGWSRGTANRHRQRGNQSKKHATKKRGKAKVNVPDCRRSSRSEIREGRVSDQESRERKKKSRWIQLKKKKECVVPPQNK